MNDLIYEHKTQGRTLYSLAFLISAIVVVLGGSNTGVPIYAYMPPGFVLLFGAWWFMSNPDHGCRLTGEAFGFWSNKEVHQIPLSEIASIKRKTWMDGPHNFTLVMKDGQNHALSHLQFGNSDEFAAALEQAGVAFSKSD